MYRLLRPLLFSLDPEFVHGLTIGGLSTLGALSPRIRPRPGRTAEVMGLTFHNRIGLAAGLDKDAQALLGLAQLGFGFIEVGTVTPRPQPGNPKPRLFRFPSQQALINRMGFNNAGVESLRTRLQAAQPRLPDTPVGVNIGKNKDTPLAAAQDDYLAAFEAVHDSADYITLNLSSPNTPGLRDLQTAAEFGGLLRAVLDARAQLRGPARALPVAVKIAPDLTAAEVDGMAAALLDGGADAVIATNTTVARPAGLPDIAGGLSGRPLTKAALAVVQRLGERLQGRLPIIGVGGIDAPAVARQFFDAGADLVQIYTGLIYSGPSLVRTLVDSDT